MNRLNTLVRVCLGYGKAAALAGHIGRDNPKSGPAADLEEVAMACRGENYSQTNLVREAPVGASRLLSYGL
jgi:hypothetical protein